MGGFGARFKECRIAAGFNQSEAASAIGVTQQAISLYERDKREPTAYVIIAMAQAYGVSIDYLLGLETPANGIIVETIVGGE